MDIKELWSNWKQQPAWQGEKKKSGAGWLTAAVNTVTVNSFGANGAVGRR